MELRRIHDTINFIEENYSTSISIEDLETVSCCSYRNLQRIFKYTCGETIGAFQIRLKVENAYKFILYTQNTLTQIAYDVGFESLASFSKAFKKQYGISPKQARLGKIDLFKNSTILPETHPGTLHPEIVFLPKTKVYYQSTHTNYVNEEIELLWEKFTENSFPAEKIDYFGIIADEQLITDEIKCRYDACCSVQPSNKKLPSKFIFGKKYAKFVHEGSYQTIDETYKSIYGNWILNTRLEFGNSPIVERYVKHSTNAKDETDYITEILIPLL